MAEMTIITRDKLDRRIELIEPIRRLRFEASRIGTVRIDEVADIAAGLCLLADDGERRGIIALAQALGVEVMR